MQTLQPPLQWQADPRWSREKLGFSNSTIGGWGCLLTCGSMLYSAALPSEITPPILNEIYKKENKYFSSGGGPKNNLWVPSMFKGIFNNSVEWVSRSVEQNKPLSAGSEAQLKQWLVSNPKHFAILKLDFDPIANDCQSHFVVAWGVASNGKVLVNDPAFNFSGTLTETSNTLYFGMKKSAYFYGKDDKDSIWRYDLVRIK